MPSFIIGLSFLPLSLGYLQIAAIGSTSTDTDLGRDEGKSSFE
jgi:hypothetical protein